jgi:hypothetical protein
MGQGLTHRDDPGSGRTSIGHSRIRSTHFFLAFGFLRVFVPSW